MQIIGRSTWGAVGEKTVSGNPSQEDVITNDPIRNADKVVIHHSVTGEGDGTQASSAAILRSIQRAHQNNNGWNDIGYHFLVDSSGRAFAGRRLDRRGAHSAPNSRAKGICYIGNTQNGLPPKDALETIKALYRHINAQAGKTLPVFMHRERQATACPGNHLASWLEQQGATKGRVPAGWVADEGRKTEVRRIAVYLNSRAHEVNKQKTTANVDGIPGPVYWTLVQALGKKDKVYNDIIDGIPGPNTYRAEKHYAELTLKPVVTTEDIEEVSSIPFSSEARESDELPKGEERVIVSGVLGKVTRVVRVTFTDGVETSREVLSEEVVSPVDEVRLVGTYEVPESSGGRNLIIGGIIAVVTIVVTWVSSLFA